MTAFVRPRLPRPAIRNSAGDNKKGQGKIAMAGNAPAHGAHDAHEHHPTGWRRFVYSTNHKDIGTMYLVFALVAGVIGGLMSVALRLEVEVPRLPGFPDSPQFYT